MREDCEMTDDVEEFLEGLSSEFADTLLHVCLYHDTGRLETPCCSVAGIAERFNVHP